MVEAKTGRSGAVGKVTAVDPAPAPAPEPAATWAKAKRLYANPDHKVADIAKLVGLAPIQLSLEAKKRGWPMRTQPKPKPGHRLEAGSARPLATSWKSRCGRSPVAGKRSIKWQNKNPLKPLELVQRVYATIEGELTKLEQQEGTSSQDRERGSRALSQIVNSLEKATDMQQVLAAKTAKGGSKKDKEALADAEDLRRQIAERLERLNRKRDAGK